MNYLFLASTITSSVLIVMLLKRTPRRNRVSDFLICSLIVAVSTASGLIPVMGGGMLAWVCTLFLDMPVSKEDSDADLKAYCHIACGVGFEPESESESESEIYDITTLDTSDPRSMFYESEPISSSHNV